MDEWSQLDTSLIRYEGIDGCSTERVGNGGTAVTTTFVVAAGFVVANTGTVGGADATRTPAPRLRQPRKLGILGPVTGLETDVVDDATTRCTAGGDTGKLGTRLAADCDCAWVGVCVCV